MFFTQAVTNSEVRNEDSLSDTQLSALVEDVLMKEEWTRAEESFDDFKKEVK